MRKSQNSTNAVSVSIVVLNYNGEKYVSGCLDSLRCQDYAGYEVIVVDNASTDQSRELICRQYPEVRLLALDKNSGFCRGNHVGVCAAKGKYIALVNNDTILAPEFIRELVRTLESNNQAWVVGPKINNLNLDMSAYPYSGSMSLTGIIIRNVFKNTNAIFGVSGAALMFRKEPVGLPFDEDYEYFHEDVYLCWRTWLTGHEVIYKPDVIVDHIGSASMRVESPWYRWLIERNRLMNILCFWSGYTLLRIFPLLMIMLVMEQAADILAGRSIAPRWKAYLWILTHLRKIVAKRRALQAQRRVLDQAIIYRMSYRVTNVKHIGGRLLNSLAWCWCLLMNLRTWEFYQGKA